MTTALRTASSAKRSAAPCRSAEGCDHHRVVAAHGLHGRKLAGERTAYDCVTRPRAKCSTVRDGTQSHLRPEVGRHRARVVEITVQPGRAEHVAGAPDLYAHRYRSR